MVVELYYHPVSYPCVAVHLMTKAGNIPVNLHSLDLFNKEHLKPDFLKINPFHTVPTIVDDGFSLWESNSIMRYLADKYVPDGHLYPKDAKARATMNRMLDFNLGTFVKAVGGWMFPALFFDKDLDKEKEEELKKLLTAINDNILSKTPYLSGAAPTIADFSLIAPTIYFDHFKFDLSPWPNVQRWVGRMRALPYYNECTKGCTEFLAKKGTK